MACEHPLPIHDSFWFKKKKNQNQNQSNCTLGLDHQNDFDWRNNTVSFDFHPLLLPPVPLGLETAPAAGRWFFILFFLVKASQLQRVGWEIKRSIRNLSGHFQIEREEKREVAQWRLNHLLAAHQSDGICSPCRISKDIGASQPLTLCIINKQTHTLIDTTDSPTLDLGLTSYEASPS